MLVKEATTRLVEVPTTYETITERIKIAEASTEWKRGSAWLSRAITTRSASGFKVGADGRVDGSRVDPNANLAGAVADDDLMCLVEIPERFETITRQVIKSPATVRQEITPAVYSTVTKQVVDRAAATRKVDIPASYQTVTYQEIDMGKLHTMGYKFDAVGYITATPMGERVFRASQITGVSGASSADTPAASGVPAGLEAYVREVKIPAEMRTMTRQVVDQPATVRTVVVPGTTQKVKSRVVIAEAKAEEITVPATFQIITRQVVDKPASTREIMIPAEFKTVERRVVDQSASMRQIPLPAVMQKASRRVIDTLASTREEVVPAVYKTESRQVMEHPASTREIDIPAQYETLTNQVIVSEASADASCDFVRNKCDCCKNHRNSTCVVEGWF